MAADYDPAADPVHGSGWNSVARWGGWDWREPRRGEHFRTCSFCGCIHPEDLAAETAGDDTCRVCGQHGWEACFRSKIPAWALHLTEAQKAILTDEERAELATKAPEHVYDPGGWWASWADRKYGWPHKFYVEGLRPRDPRLLHCMGHGSGGDGSRPNHGNPDTWVAAKDLTRAQRKIIKADGVHASGKFDGWYQFAPRATLHAKFYTIHLADPRISYEVKDSIAKASGLRFHFEPDGRVRWEPMPA